MILVSDLYWLLQILQPFQSCRFGIATWYLSCCLCVCATSQYFTPRLPFAWSGMCNSSAAPAEHIPRDWCWTCSWGDKSGATPLLVVTPKHTSLDSGSSYLLQDLVSKWMAGRLNAKWFTPTLLKKKKTLKNQNKTPTHGSTSKMCRDGGDGESLLKTKQSSAKWVVMALL